ncbi:MAG: pyridoxamine 5'-phosphate oxidase family protein [Saprospiraceae bacterium]|nr:pyridoxamine 5'-phosphate oxidase family protein [Saprospiraceae bacterium]
MSDIYPTTSRNTVKRVPKRAHYDQETIFSILDAGFLAHVGISVDGQPFVIPTAYGRKGETIYLHGATTSRLIKTGQEGFRMCIIVTHLDGIVLARSAFHHSMNYRSAVLFGTATLVPDAEKEAALFMISEQILKGRWEESRLPNAKELKATSVLAFQIEEASAKIREGGPGDESEDYALPIWAGVLPMQQIYGPPIPDEVLTPGIPLPESVTDAVKGKG